MRPARGAGQGTTPGPEKAVRSTCSAFHPVLSGYFHVTNYFPAQGSLVVNFPASFL